MVKATDEKVRVEAWRTVQGDLSVAGELQAFRTAVIQRFGEEGVRAMLRGHGQPGAVAAMAPEQQRALDQVARLIATLSQGERAHKAVAQHASESERQTQRRGLKL